MLEGTGLQARVLGNILIVEPVSRPQSDAGDEAPMEVDTIVVTGSRIRGALPAAPVIRKSREGLRAEGRTSLADAIADIPQNFGGGQNPGVNSAVPANNGVNVNGASSLNLRGLGSDATLTLLNGRRVSYSASRQSIDVSTVPFEALDRIEVVADGSSALYGSDAVGGVANIILREPYDGGVLSAKAAGSTHGGGGFAQQYGVGLGRTWTSGGLMFAAEYGNQDVLWSEERAITSNRPGITLYPDLEDANAVLSVRQALTSRLSLDLDTLYNTRRSFFAQAYDASGRPYYSGGLVWSDTEPLMIAPALKADLPGGWVGSLFASYGEDTTHFGNRTYSAGVASEITACYCNTATQIEAAADGALMQLPADRSKRPSGAVTGAANSTSIAPLGRSTNGRNRAWLSPAGSDRDPRTVSSGIAEIGVRDPFQGATAVGWPKAGKTCDAIFGDDDVHVAGARRHAVYRGGADATDALALRRNGGGRQRDHASASDRSCARPAELRLAADSAELPTADDLGVDLTPDIHLKRAVDGHHCGLTVRQQMGRLDPRQTNRRIAVAEPIGILRPENRAHDADAWRLGLETIGHDAPLDQVDQAVAKHAGMDAEVSSVGQVTTDGVGNGSDAQLERGPVVNKTGDIDSDRLGDFIAVRLRGDWRRAV